VIHIVALRERSVGWGYNLYLGRELLVSFIVSWTWGSSSFQWEGVRYDLYREFPCFGAFVISSGGRILARATKNSVFTRAFTVRIGDRTLRLRAAHPFTRRFILEDQNYPLGEVNPETAFSPPAWFEFPEDFPIPTCVFLFWLVVLLWRRQKAFNHHA